MDYAQLQFGHQFYTINLPTGWDDLTAEQFEAVNFIKCTATDRRQMIFEILMVLLPLNRTHLLGLLKLSMRQKQWLQAFNLASLYIWFDKRYLWKFFTTEDVLDALPAIDWVFDANPIKHRSAIASFQFKGVTYNGPRTLLSGVIWKQMQLADTLADRFAKEKNEELLNHLAAVLYVPAGEALDTDNDSIPERVKLFSGLRIQLKYAIYANYVLLRDSFYKQFKLPQAELAVEGRPDWERTTLLVAENGSLGTYAQVETAPARTVMKYFEMAHDKNRPKK